MKSSTEAVWRNVRRWLPGVLISLVILFVLFRLADWGEVLAAFASIHPVYMLAAVLLTLAFIFVRAISWRILLNGRASIRDAFIVINEGYLINNILPFRAGELGRAVFLGRSSGLSAFQVLSTVVIERIFDIVFAATLLLSTLPLVLGMDWARSIALVILGLMIGGLVVLFLMVRRQDMVNGWVDRLGNRSGFVRRIIAPKVASLLQGFSALQNPRQVILSFLLIGLSWLIAVTEYWIMLLPIAPEAPFWWGIFTDSVLALGIAIPSAPGSLGVFEGAIVAALTLLGISHSSALAYAIVLHFLQFAVTGLIGGYGLIKEGKSLGDLFSSLRIRREAS